MNHSNCLLILIKVNNLIMHLCTAFETLMCGYCYLKVQGHVTRFMPYSHKNELFYGKKTGNHLLASVPCYIQCWMVENRQDHLPVMTLLTFFKVLSGQLKSRVLKNQSSRF